MLSLLQLYNQHYPAAVPEIQAETATIDLNFIIEDLPKLLSSMQSGADRIRKIVLSLRNFSRLEQAEMKAVDIHEGSDNTLVLLQHRLRPQTGKRESVVIKEYGNLPWVECYAAQLNQVFNSSC
ncbi:integral membrane sensor signal transduction histidine kinase [Microseira wollei NIES-4236]|uniref:Integral membrane sensor signal transduction histidine kinase n=1 Tax=Microseira wollei NIES-4236 TaxID=2530354 RepID=A0AAV3XGV4_9CYAN|nr:hypothetical protein [Microseira wollei]GET40170.1 integral membrane sensor signal transduction histidine kinase [Microseira wollei NIES-4236]